jgi:GTPase SAR1 family protein
MSDVEAAASSGGGAGPAIVTPGDSAVRVYKIVVMGDGSSGKVRQL